MSHELTDNFEQEVSDRLEPLPAELAIDAAPPDDISQDRLRAQFQLQRDRLTRAYQIRRQAILAERDAERAAIQERYEARKKSAGERLATATRKVHKRFKSRLRQARDDREKSKRAAHQQYEQLIQQAEESLWCRGEIFALQHQELKELVAAVEAAMDQSGFAAGEAADHPPPDDPSRGPKRRFLMALDRCRGALAAIQEQASGQKNLQRFTPLLFVVVSAAAIFIIGAFLQWQGWHWILGGGAGGPLLLLLISYQVLLPAARRRGAQAYTDFRHASAHAAAAIDEMFTAAKTKYGPGETGLLEVRDRRIAQADARWKKAGGMLKAARDRRIAGNQEKVKARREQIAHDRHSQLAELEYRVQPQLEILAEEHELQMAELVQLQVEQLAGPGCQGDAVGL